MHTIFRTFALSFVAVVAFSASCLAGDTLSNALQGYSIVVSYSEIVNTRHGSFHQTLTVKLYVSSKGRIFTKHSMVSDRPGRTRSRDFISGEESDSAGVGRYTWSASGLSRHWINGRGRSITETIAIQGSGGNFSCQMSLSRGGGGGGGAAVTGSSCRVFKGNAVAGR